MSSVNLLDWKGINLPSHRVLRYVKRAVGETDVPDALPEFISQRRRWLNGSFFAAVYAVAHAKQILRSGHATGRKVVLMLETVYNVINLIFSWFAIVRCLLGFRLMYAETGPYLLCYSGKLLFILCESCISLQ